jgi:hypothetical protein
MRLSRIMRAVPLIAAMSLAAVLGGCACLTPPSGKAVELEKPLVVSAPSLEQPEEGDPAKSEDFGSL